MIEVPTGRVCGTHWPGLGSVRGVLGAMPGQDTQKNQGRVLVGKLKWATLKPLSLDGRTESTLQTFIPAPDTVFPEPTRVSWP